jgi:hypothetical protein
MAEVKPTNLVQTEIRQSSFLKMGGPFCSKFGLPNCFAVDVRETNRNAHKKPPTTPCAFLYCTFSLQHPDTSYPALLTHMLALFTRVVIMPSQKKY